MIESDSDDVRELLGTALRGEPPSAFDPAALVRLGKRRLRLQRAGAALSVMVVAGGITLGAALIHRGGSAGPDQISSAGSPSLSATTPSGSSSPPAPLTSVPSAPNVTPVLPDAKTIIAEQNQVLLAGQPVIKGTKLFSGSLTFTPDVPVSQDYVGSELSSRIGDASGSGDFSMTVTVVNSALGAPACTSSLMNCTIEPVDGFPVMVESDHPTAKTTRIFTVALIGNVLVNGQVDNLSAPGSKTASRPAPPMSEAALAQLTVSIGAATK